MISLKKQFILASSICGIVICSSAVTPPLNTNRIEVLKYFAENVYGVRPDLTNFKKTCKVVNKGQRRDVTLNVMTPVGETNFTAVAFLPKCAANKRVPCFVYISFSKPDDMLMNPGHPEFKPHRWPVDGILEQGFATVSFNYEDVMDDHGSNASKFGKDQGRPANGWGAISTWALAASRVMDWLETADGIDSTKVAIIGHSRLGKTSLWAGATDSRFAYVISNNSGCMGARVSTRNIADQEPISYGKRSCNCGETIESISRVFPHWFAPKFRTQFAGKDNDLPFDQHWLIAAVAPRLMVVGSAEGDQWACPSGEHASLDLARPAWGVKQDRCHYHLRPGKHDINWIDWSDYIDFAKKHGW